MIYRELKEERFELSRDERGFYDLKLVAGEEVTIDDVKKIEAFIATQYNGDRIPLLVEMEYGATVSEGVQEHLKSSPSRHSTADAFVIHTFAHKLIVQFYLKFYQPTKPTKVFSSKDKAAAWIKTQMRA